MKITRMIAILSLAFCSLIMQSAFAAQPNVQKAAGNVDDNIVEVKAWIGTGKGTETKDSYAVTEQAILTIDLGTPRWFLGSTTIGKIDVPNLIAKKRNTLATNYTERRNGQTWAHQRWEITLYPQASGQFTIPPLPVTLHIAGDGGKKTEGTVWTERLAFQSILPDAHLTQKDHWFAATDVKVNQDWETTQSELKVGDAVTRTIKIEANDSLSMLLPQVMKGEATPSYQAYADPATLSDRSVRGDYVSDREDKVVYVMQDGGEVTFPSYQVKWWNTKTQKVETITLEGKTFKVSHTFSSFVKAYWRVLVAVLVVILLLIGGILAIRRYYQTHELPLGVQFNRALSRENFAQARLLFYIKLKRLTGNNTFAEEEKFSEFGDKIAKEGSASKWRYYWTQLKVNKNKAKRTQWRDPLHLEEKLQEIDTHK